MMLSASAAAPSGRSTEFELSDSQFQFLSELAHRRTGIVLAEGKRDMVYGRLVRRLRSLALDSFAEYCQLLSGEHADDEMGHLINAITTNLTGFFREEHHFEHLTDHLATLLPKQKRLRLWSAACSSGMEPYSMAMVLQAALGKTATHDAKILATDIDTAMLQTGRAGTYRTSDVEKVPTAYRKDYAELDGERVVMGDALRQLITFKPLNLLEAWPMRGPFDVIFCRNVVIYFDKPTKVELFDRMADMLTPGGLLYIGHSENLHNICNRFELVGRTIYQRVA